MTVRSIADITGDNAPHAISSTSGPRARRLFLTAHSGSARLGDASVTAARGVELPTDVEVTVSASDADPTDSIDLSAVYAYVPSGTTLTISYAV